MTDRPTEFEDLDDDAQQQVEKHLLAALEAADLDYHYLDGLLEGFDTCLTIAAEDMR